MDLRMLDESKIIQEIRKRGEDIFSSDEEDPQMSFELTESDNHLEERLQPFIQPLRASVNQMQKHYLSPYSQKMIKERMSTSASNREGTSIRKKIFSVHNEFKKIQQEKADLKQQNENKKFKSIQPKYLQRQPLMKNAQQIQKNIYGRLKTETEHLKRQRSMSKEENEMKWNNFIQKSSQWQQVRENNRIKAKISQSMKVNQELQTRITSRPPPQVTVDECLQKLRRHAQKLKEKLNLYTFEPKLYETERNKHKMSKSKDKQKTSHKNQPKELVERKFTVLTNPKKQLQFMFK